MFCKGLYSSAWTTGTRAAIASQFTNNLSAAILIVNCCSSFYASSLSNVRICSFSCLILDFQLFEYIQWHGRRHSENWGGHFSQFFRLLIDKMVIQLIDKHNQQFKKNWIWTFKTTTSSSLWRVDSRMSLVKQQIQQYTTTGKKEGDCWQVNKDVLSEIQNLSKTNVKIENKEEMQSISENVLKFTFFWTENI